MCGLYRNIANKADKAEDARKRTRPRMDRWPNARVKQRQVVGPESTGSISWFICGTQGCHLLRGVCTPRQGRGLFTRLGASISFSDYFLTSGNHAPIPPLHFFIDFAKFVSSDFLPNLKIGISPCILLLIFLWNKDTKLWSDLFYLKLRIWTFTKCVKFWCW